MYIEIYFDAVCTLYIKTTGIVNFLIYDYVKHKLLSAVRF
jgi:hypothetical protein